MRDKIILMIVSAVIGASVIYITDLKKDDMDRMRNRLVNAEASISSLWMEITYITAKMEK